MQQSLLGLLSEQSSLSAPTVGELWRDICETCDLGIATLLRLAAAAGIPGRQDALRRMLGERVVRITVKPFMDMHTMIEERLTQCCVHVGTRSETQAPVRAVSVPRSAGRPAGGHEASAIVAPSLGDAAGLA